MTDDPKQAGARRQAMVEAGDVLGALSALDECIAHDPDDHSLYRERAHLHLYLRQTRHARADLDAAEALVAGAFPTRPGRLHSNLACDAIGVTYWMEGHRELALAFWRYTTRELTANRVSYAPSGGGIESGLLLWFGAVHERRPEDVDLVRALYENRMASKLWSHRLTSWPGPIVSFFFEQIDEPALLEHAADSAPALSEAHFALAVRARERSRHAAYRKHMNAAAPGNGAEALYDHYNILPYFLGRFESDHRGP